MKKFVFVAYHPDHGISKARFEFPYLIHAESLDRAEYVANTIAESSWEVGPASNDWFDELTDDQRQHFVDVGWVEVRRAAN